MISDPLDSCRFWAQDTVAPHTFTDAQIQEFLDLCKVPDSDGYRPLETGYTPTYDVLRAAGYAWLYRAGSPTNKANSVKIGDVSYTFDKGYCLSRARELMGSASSTATRRDEPCYEQHRKEYHDGEPRNRS